MGYNINDILLKIINVEKRIQSNISNAIDYDANNVIILNVLSKIFIKESNKRINLYKSLINEDINLIDEIDFISYDKIAFLYNECIQKLGVEKVKTPKEYLKFMKDLVLDRYSLLIDIQGRLMNNTKDNNSVTYKVLSKLINDTNNQINNLNALI